jgi:hypothetical protein
MPLARRRASREPEANLLSSANELGACPRRTGPAHRVPRVQSARRRGRDRATASRRVWFAGRRPTNRISARNRSPSTAFFDYRRRGEAVRRFGPGASQPGPSVGKRGGYRVPTRTNARRDGDRPRWAAQRKNSIPRKRRFSTATTRLRASASKASRCGEPGWRSRLPDECSQLIGSVHLVAGHGADRSRCRTNKPGPSRHFARRVRARYVLAKDVAARRR